MLQVTFRRLQDTCYAIRAVSDSFWCKTIAALYQSTIWNASAIYG